METTQCGSRQSADLLGYVVVLLLSVALLAMPAEEATGILPGGRTLVWLALVSAAIAWGSWLLLQRRTPKVGKIPTAALAGWVAWSALSVLWARDQSLSWERVVIIVQSLVFFILLQDVLSHRGRLRIAVWVYFLGASAAALSLLFLSLARAEPQLVLVATQSPISFAQALGLAFLASPLVFSWCRGLAARVLVLVAADALFLAMIFTNCRASWLGLLAAIPLAWILSGNRLRALRWLLPCAAVLAVQTALVMHNDVAPPATEWRMQTMFDIKENQGGSGRLNIWRVGWEMVEANPFLGVGVGNFPIRFEDYVDAAGLGGAYAVYAGRDPHSVPLSLLSELGPVGLALALLFVLAVAVPLARRTRASPAAVIGIAFMVFLATVSLASTIQYSKYFWWGCGIAAIMGSVPRARELY